MINGSKRRKMSTTISEGQMLGGMGDKCHFTSDLSLMVYLGSATRKWVFWKTAWRCVRILAIHSALRKLWSDCADAQADQRLRWAHIQSCMKCCASALTCIILHMARQYEFQTTTGYRTYPKYLDVCLLTIIFLKGSKFHKNKTFFFIQERFNKLIYSIIRIIKCGIWQPVKFY